MLNYATLIEEWVRGTIRDPGQHFRARVDRSCPCCGYRGKFVSAKRRKRPDFRCPNCSSRPRDRQIALILDERSIDLAAARFLHIAPEWPLFRKLRHNPNYVGGDIIARRNRNVAVDITDISFADHAFDFVMANHVLEHVPDDRRAMREAFRVLAPGGQAIFTVPIQGRAETWEPPPGMSSDEIERICGWDHVRLYGLDLKQRLEDAGFACEIISSTPEDCATYSLLDDDVVFFCTKRADAPVG